MKEAKRHALLVLEIVLMVGALIFLGIFAYNTVVNRRQADQEQQMRDEIRNLTGHAAATDAADDVEADTVEP